MSLKNFLLSKPFLKNLGFAAMITFGAIMILLLWMNIYTRHGQARPVPNFIGLTMDQTIQLAKKSKLRYQIIDSVYSTDVQRGCIAEQSPKAGFKVKKWRNIILTINAFHPEMVAMPNLINLPKRQAILIAESSGLEIGLLKYRPDISTDMVIDQEHNGRKIQEGDSIQKGSVVDLVLGKGLSDQRTPVPDLVGMKLNPSRNKILASSLNLGTYVYDKTIVNSADTLNAFVYKQNPEYVQDASLKLGSSIYLWLTVDSSKLHTTPDLINPDSIPPAAVSDNQSN
jgi:eukaryotic-like serine/threonine-protein kinase